MSSNNRKARDFENDVMEWLGVIFPRIQRTGIGFEGSDYRETGPFAIEAKNHARLDLSTWMKQTVLNKEREKRKYPVLIHKRRRYGTAQAYVTMPLENYVEMLADLLGIEMPDDLRPVSEWDFPAWGEL